MGTISDKLMRIINTKEDIRQALISKGYDVPTSIPFKEYAKMISDLPCRVDSFPDIEGIVARYSALGLTNEQMAANPVWVDKTGNGHDLQMKNFAWKEGSGISDIYPGALVFDGVDDYGACDNFPILTKEKGYTVVALRQYLVDKSTAYLTANGDSISNTSFILEGNNYRDTWSFGKATTIQASRILATQTSKQYDGVKLNIGTNAEGSNLLQVGKWSKSYSNVAIWELVFLDHDATEEELTKIKDYFVKTYPWLFPDQAWTVTGKTNEDEDRATIANITGNGNDLLLSNFGFAQGSGYGLYYQYFGNEFKATNGEIEGGGWNIIDNYNISHDKRIPINSIGKCFWGNKALVNGIKLRFKLTGMTEGDVLAFGYAATYDLTYTSDGIYAIDLPPVDKSYGFSLQSSLTENLPTTPVTIELLPFEYEGYLVTDGVDDIASSNTIIYEADFTFIGEWKFIQKDDTVAGINSSSHLYIQNRYNRGATVMINSTFENKKNITDYMTFKAITSKGKGYDENWNEVDLLYGDGNKGPSGVNIGGQGGTEFCHMIFKNMALYMNKVFSKDECIKAYNYLQTLKSK